MAFGSFNGKGGPAPMADINVIPLVDIAARMLSSALNLRD